MDEIARDLKVMLDIRINAVKVGWHLLMRVWHSIGPINGDIFGTTWSQTEFVSSIKSRRL